MQLTVTEVTIENLGDLWDVGLDLLPADRVRRVTVPDATVDVRSVLVRLPTRLIRELGLKRYDTGLPDRLDWRGQVEYSPVRLTIQGRCCSMDVTEVPDDQGASIGHTVLTHLDLVIDPLGHSLTGNPDQGGEQIYDLC